MPARTRWPLVLYSCQTLLAFRINRAYFEDRHFVWCTPHFDSEAARVRRAAAPPTASPADIYHSLWQEVTTGDRHSAKIASHRVGLLKGATERLRQGLITPRMRSEIAAVLERAETSDFEPLIYVIPYAGVRRRAKRVVVTQRAHPLSEEFIVADLRGEEFDVIRLRRTP